MSSLVNNLSSCARRPVPVILAVYFLMLLLFFQIGLFHDAFQYYGFTVSLLNDGDLDFYNQIYLGNSLKHHNPFPWESSRYLGTSILEVPAFIAGDAFCRLFNSVGFCFPANGYSLPYMFFVSLFSSLAGLAGIIVFYKLCLRFLSEKISLMVSLVLMLCTPLAFFMYCWSGWPHTYSFLFVSSFVYAWHSSIGSLALRRFVALGVIYGIIAIIRPLDLIVGVFLAVELWGRCRSARRSCFEVLKAFSAFSASAFAVLSPQLLMWKVVTGRWLASPYVEVGDSFNFLNPAVWAFLFSVPQHGLLVWSPILLLVIPGLYLLYRKDRLTGVSALFVTILFVYLTASWSVWWTGIGYSNRFVIGVLPVLGLALGSCLERWRSGRVRWLIWPVLSLVVVINLLSMNAYRFNYITQGIPDPGMIPQKLDLASLLTVPITALSTGGLDFIRGQWFNEPFFLSRFAYSIYRGTGSEFFFAMSAFALSVVFAICITKLVLGRAGRQYKFVAICLILLLIVYADAKIISASVKGGVEARGYRYPYSGVVDLQGGSNRIFTINYPVPVRSIDLVTTLTYAHPFPNDYPAAEVTVYGLGGYIKRYTMLTGRDTAESSYLRREYHKDIQHTIYRAVPVRSSWTRQYSKSAYELLWYLSSIRLDEPVVVTKIKVKYLPLRGTMLIGDVFMREVSAPSKDSSAHVYDRDMVTNKHLPLSARCTDFVSAGSNLFAAATAGGLVMFDQAGRPVQKITSSDRLPSDTVTALLACRDGLWAGTSAGLALMRSSSVSGLMTVSDVRLAGRIIYSLSIDPKGGIIVGTDRGAYRLDIAKPEANVNPPNDFARRSVYAVFTANDDSVWFGLENGLLREMPDNRWQTFQNNPFLHVTNNCIPDNCVMSVSGDKSGNIWVGTGKGLARYDGAGWRSWPASDGDEAPLSDSIKTLAVDGAGTVWLGYGNAGPSKMTSFDGRVWRHYGAAEKVKCDELHRIVIDGSGAKLLSTDWGAVRFSDEGIRYYISR